MALPTVLLALLLLQDDEDRVRWVELETARKKAAEEKKGILVVVRPANESEMPSGFSDKRVRDASRDLALFVRIRFGEEDDVVREARIERAPALVALDEHLNVYGIWYGSPGSNRILEACRGLPGWIAERRSAVQAKLNDALRLNQAGDLPATIKALQGIRNSGVKGFPQVEQARRMLASLAETEFRKIEEAAKKEAADPKEIATRWRNAARAFGSTEFGPEAELRLARYRLSKEDAQDALSMAKRIARARAKDFPDKAAEAERFIEEIGLHGIRRMREALVGALRGNPSETAAEIRRLQKLYSGTRAEQEAGFILKDLES